MSEVILKAEDISKQYRLGLVGTGTLNDDFKRWWYKIRGKEDPFLKVGAVNDRSVISNSNYVWALQDINFEVKRGEVLGIIGKNGAGKSTLLKILSRVTAPTTGQIKTKGRIASLLEVGTGFHPELTGRENIFLNGAILGMTKAEIRAKEEEIIEFSGCAGYIDTPVKRYSSGMRVRLAFAVAAHLEPDILVVDEVLAVGDAEFQKKAVGKMQDISKGDGRTVLFVSHNMESIQQLCTKCIVLEKGLIQFSGNVEKGIDVYLGNNKPNNARYKFPILLGDLSIEKFSISDERTDAVRNLILGKPYFFFLKIKNGKTDKKINVRIQIFDSRESLITTFNTIFTNSQFIIKSDDTLEIKCCFEKNSLAPGDYKVGLQIKNLNNREVLIEDNSINEFSIVNGDFYNTGKIPIKMHLGKVFLEPKWLINNDS